MANEKSLRNAALGKFLGRGGLLRPRAGCCVFFKLRKIKGNFSLV